MSIKPILFNTEMVRAILEGRKTVTRRVVKPRPSGQLIPALDDECWPGYFAEVGTPRMVCPPYRPGDILYVREAWNGDWCDHYIYKADGGSAKSARYGAEPKWHPSIHMPREAARLFLRVTDVRVERLRDITLDDGYKEGCDRPMQFDALWDSTIKPADRALYGWDANPWGWVIKFERCEKPEAAP